MVRTFNLGTMLAVLVVVATEVPEDVVVPSIIGRWEYLVM
jgi:hypothetical protein